MQKNICYFDDYISRRNYSGQLMFRCITQMWLHPHYYFHVFISWPDTNFEANLHEVLLLIDIVVLQLKKKKQDKIIEKFVAE